MGRGIGFRVQKPFRAPGRVGVGGRGSSGGPRPRPPDPENRCVLTKTNSCALQPLQSTPNHPRNGFVTVTNTVVEEGYFCNLFGLIFFAECEPCSRTPRRIGMQIFAPLFSHAPNPSANTRGIRVGITETPRSSLGGRQRRSACVRGRNVSTRRVTQPPIFGSRFLPQLSSSLSFSLSKLTRLVFVCRANIPRVFAAWREAGRTIRADFCMPQGVGRGVWRVAKMAHETRPRASPAHPSATQTSA